MLGMLRIRVPTIKRNSGIVEIRHSTRSGYQSKQDYTEVEQVPAVTEVQFEARGNGGDFKNCLDDKCRKYKMVAEFKPVALVRYQCLDCLQPEDRGIKQNEGND
jgi:hypothetical protein